MQRFKTDKGEFSMLKFIRRAALPAIWAALFGSLAVAQTAPPAIFYSDLQSGPNTGGENNNGAYVTVYGKRFGASQGSSYVIVGSGKAVNYKVWTDTKISFQLGSAASSGSIKVTTGNGSSNSVPFTVRAGNIYFVATNGSDGNSGSFSAPWNTIPHAASSMSAGDITYVRNGVSATSDNGYGSPLNISGTNGSAGKPIALVVYPGESAAIGGSGNTRGIIQYPSGAPFWVIVGFTITLPNSSEALHLYPGSSNWRIVANSFSCPNGGGSTGCVTSDGAPYIDFLGNTIHDTGCPGSMATGPCNDTQKTYHAFYFGDLSGNLNHDINVGWNTVKNVYGCRGLQFHSKDSSPGYEAYSLQVHDNRIYNVRCDGINLANVNPDKGSIVVYNNIMYHVGTGPDPSGQAANYACVNAGDSNGSPKTNVEVFNNTCYDGGGRGASEGDAGAFSFSIPARLRNNIAYELAGEAYLTSSTINGCGSCVTGTNNLWFGVGVPPQQTSANISANPLFTNLSSFDFHLQSGSPAKDAGVPIASLAADFDGIPRPQGSAFDVGALEYFQGSSSSQTNACDLNADGTVDNTDVQIAVAQAIGTAACGTADLQQNGTCNVIDVQRVSNAALGQSCRTGP